MLGNKRVKTRPKLELHYFKEGAFIASDDVRMRIPWKAIRGKRLLILVTLTGLVLISSSFLRIFETRTARIDVVHQSRQLTVARNDLLRNIQSSNSPQRVTSAVPKTEVQHIAFLKVHKAASSTAQNIFLRFGWNRNLTFVLAPAKNPAGYPNIISLRESLTNSNILPPPPDKHYDIMCNHVFYSYDAFKTFMPEDTVFIGIVREPFEHYKSVLNYFHPRYIFTNIKSNNPASEFLRDPSKYEPKGKLSNSWTNSRMAIEFGFPEELFQNYSKTKVDEYIQKTAREFTLVLVAEIFEESVIIMRRLLNWQTKDIVYLDQNIARRKNESMVSYANDRDFYKEYAKIDYDLYNFFYKQMKELIRREGSDFDDELLAFKEVRKAAQDYCKQSKFDKPMFVPGTLWGQNFTVTKSDCWDMRRGEIDFITKIRIRQYGTKDI